MKQVAVFDEEIAVALQIAYFSLTAWNVVKLTKIYYNKDGSLDV